MTRDKHKQHNEPIGKKHAHVAGAKPGKTRATNSNLLLVIFLELIRGPSKPKLQAQANCF